MPGTDTGEEGAASSSTRTSSDSETEAAAREATKVLLDAGLLTPLPATTTHDNLPSVLQAVHLCLRAPELRLVAAALAPSSTPATSLGSTGVLSSGTARGRSATAPGRMGAPTPVASSGVCVLGRVPWVGSRCTWAAHPHWFLHARVCLCVMCTLHTFPHHSSRLEPLYHCPWQLWRLGRWGTGQRGPAKGCHFRCSNWSAHNVRRGAERRPGCAGRSVAALDGWGSRGHWTRPRPYVNQRLQGCGP